MAQYFFDLAGPPGGLPFGFAVPLGYDQTAYKFKSRAPGMLVADGANFTFGSMVVGGLEVGDCDALVKFRFHRWGDTSNYKGLGIYMRAQDTGSSDSYIVTQVANTDRTLILRQKTTTLNSNTSAFPATKVLGTWYFLRVQAVGTTIRAKAWVVGTEEPAAWGVSATDATYSTGWVGLCSITDQPSVTDVEFFSVGTGSDMAPTSPLWKTVSGMIRDVNGDPCSRVVRAYHRQHGYLLGETTSDAVTGAYSISVATNDEIVRIAYAANGVDLYNDLIDRVIPG